MRQLYVHVPRDAAQRVIGIAARHDTPAPLTVDARRGAEEWALLTLCPPNDRVGLLIREVEEAVDRAEFILSPHEVLPLRPPVAEVGEGVLRVRPISTMELVLASIQSAGGWRGMLLYALLSGVIAAYAVIFDIMYLLVGAMLVAPMGAPVLVTVIAVSIGDWRLAWRGLLRFTASIAVLVAAAALLGWVYGLSFSTTTMEQTTDLSRYGLLLALAAGAAGALSQLQSDRSSLVSGTAMGYLVAGALSPTSAVLGLAIVLARWEYVGMMAFQVGLQFSAVVLGGFLSARLFGVRPSDPTLGRGSPRGRAALVAGTAIAVVVLFAWQLSRGVGFRKADSSRDLVEIASAAAGGVRGARVVEANARFTRPNLVTGTRETALLEVTVEHGAGEASAPMERRVEEAVREAIQREAPEVIPYIRVILLPVPEALRRP